MSEVDVDNPEQPGTPAQIEEEPIIEEPGAEDQHLTGPDMAELIAAIPDGFQICPTCIGQMIVPTEPPFDPTKHTCPTCKGHGELRVPGSANGQQTIKCDNCSGNGWLQDGEDVLPSRPAIAADVLDDRVPVDHEGRTPADPDFDWGRIVEQSEREAEQLARERVSV